MKKIIPVILVIIISFCSCVEIKKWNFSESNIDDNVSKTSSSPQNTTSQNTKTIVLKIDNTPNAKNTTKYNKSLIFPKTSFNSIKQDDYHYYKNLPANLKQNYLKICRAIENMAYGFVDLGNVSNRDVSLLFSSVKNDHPEYFWVGTQYIVNTTANSKQIAFKFKNKTYSVNYLMTPETSNKIAAKIKLAIANIEKKLKNTDNFNVELAVHNYLTNNCQYNHNIKNDNDNYGSSYSIYGALVKKTAVCEGYAKAMQLILNHFGINTIPVYGELASTRHMWNMVLINNNWYHLDATSDDSGSRISYAYFNLSDKALKVSHSISKDFNKTKDNELNKGYNYNIPVAKSEEKNYFKINKTLIKSYDDIFDNHYDIFDEAIINNKSSVDFGYSSKFTPTNGYPSAQDISNYFDITSLLSQLGDKHGYIISDISISTAQNRNFQISWKSTKIS